MSLYQRKGTTLFSTNGSFCQKLVFFFQINLPSKKANKQKNEIHFHLLPRNPQLKQDQSKS